MPRPKRRDYPGAIHHVMNRGIARRSTFETVADSRLWLSLLARQVREGRVKVLAFCVMSTHFHVLLESPLGELSHAMQRIENNYVRWFNRSRRRDGPLFRGRFRSKLVECPVYMRILVRYIDQNPVAAGMVKSAADYPFCTAFYWRTGAIPPWISTDWVNQELLHLTASGHDRWAAYQKVFGISLSQEHVDWVERRLESQGAHEPLRELLFDSGQEAQLWMSRRAYRADGTVDGLAIIGGSSVAAALSTRAGELAAVHLGNGPRKVDGASALHAALLRDLCGFTFREIAATLDTSQATARHRYQMHRRAIAVDGTYSQVAGWVTRDAIRMFMAG